jgi:hypothetical protein
MIMNADEIALRLGVLDLMARYVHAGDEGDIDGFGKLFGSDGVLEVVRGPSATGAAEVSAQLKGFVDGFNSAPGFAPFHHHQSSVRIDVLGSDEAAVSSYFAVISAGGLDHWGTWENRAKQVGGRWVFSRRTITVSGCAPDSPAAMVAPEKH